MKGNGDVIPEETSEITCYSCGAKGCKTKEQYNSTGASSKRKSREETWWSLHKTTTCSDEECVRVSGASKAIRYRSTYQMKQDEAENFSKGVFWATFSTGGQTPARAKNTVTILVNIEVPDTRIDDQLMP